MEWGAEHDEPVIAWHGLARTGRDMDESQHISRSATVCCVRAPSVAGCRTGARSRRASTATEASTLPLRGDSSDLLRPEVAEEMRRRGPRAAVVTIAGCGHAPALNVPDQLELVERFLRA